MTVLELIAALPGQAKMSDVCELLSLPKASAHRLLAGLGRAGLVEGGGRHGAYTVGKRLARLLHTAAGDDWVVALSRPIIEALAAKRGETCYLTRLVGHRVRVVFTASPEVQWRSYVQPGLELPPHAAAATKAILAFQETALIDQALNRELVAFTTQTRTDRGAVLSEYARVRERGYGTCLSEIDEGLGALASPVHLSDGSVVYSIGLTGPVQRIFNHDEPVRLDSLARAAKLLGRSLSIGLTIVRRHDAPETLQPG